MKPTVTSLCVTLILNLSEDELSLAEAEIGTAMSGPSVRDETSVTESVRMKPVNW